MPNSTVNRRVRASMRNTLNRTLLLERRLPGYRKPDVAWLFVATLPNSGSTALAKVLRSGRGVASLDRNGEGQWLLPEMSDLDRWNPDMHPDYDVVRAVWLHQAGKHVPAGSLVVEKSPPNLIRMRELRGAFSDFDQQLLLLTREPLAVCASWAKRYPPGYLRKSWLPADTPAIETEEDYFRTIGRVCGERMTVLLSLQDADTMTVSYEDLTESPQETVERLAVWCPHLATVDANAQVSGVKDYEDQQLRNMNHEQIATLSTQARDWIGEALTPYADVLRTFGYAV